MLEHLEASSRLARVTGLKALVEDVFTNISLSVSWLLSLVDLATAPLRLTLDLTLGDLLELAGLPANRFNFKFVDDLDLGFLDGYTSEMITELASDLTIFLKICHPFKP